MNLISKFSDYYDSSLAYGVDKTIVYKRENKEIEFECRDTMVKKRTNVVFDNFPPVLKDVIESLSNLDSLSSWRSPSTIYSSVYKCTMTVRYFAVIFCGQLYPAYSIHKSSLDGKDNESFHIYCYSLEDFKNEMLKYTEQEYIDNFLNGKTSKCFGGVFTHKMRFSELDSLKNNDFSAVHHYLDSPILLIKLDKVVLNPVLKDYKFAKEKDPFTAYQEIEQYISGVMGGSTPKMVEISDIDRLVGHGFDKQTSFRKGKEKT